MIKNYINNYIARQTIQLKNVNTFISFVTTLWNNEVIMCCFNNFSGKITNIFCRQTIEGEDLLDLESIVSEFLINSDLTN